MKEKRPARRPLSKGDAALTLKETVMMPGIGLTIPVRVAKAKLSALLEPVAQGQEFASLLEEDVIRLFPLHRVVLERAGAMQRACHPSIPLRTLDALHVATCDLHQCGKLSTTDARMRAACERFGIALGPADMAELNAA
jgi:predicted nucleic acid-binding protein